jgi:hypothetical protein
MKAKRILLSFIAITFVLRSEPVDTVWSILSTTLDGKQVEAKVRLLDERKAPQWKNTDNDPPLAVKDAIRLARAYAEKFNKQGLILSVGNVTLKSLGASYYVYVVQFIFLPESGKMDGFTPPLNIVVLMDGTVVIFSDVVSKKSTP